MARRQHLTLTLVAVMFFLVLTYHMSSRSSDEHSPLRAHDQTVGYTEFPKGSSGSGSDPVPGISDSILQGGSIAPKLENATAKYAAQFFPSTLPKLTCLPCYPEPNWAAPLGSSSTR